MHFLQIFTITATVLDALPRTAKIVLFQGVKASFLKFTISATETGSIFKSNLSVCKSLAFVTLVPLIIYIKMRMFISQYHGNLLLIK